MKRQCTACQCLAEGFYTDSGVPEPNADLCSSCHIAYANDKLRRSIAEETSKRQKLEILFGEWWPHYTPRWELRYTLYFERRHCPYCGEELGPCDAVGASASFPFENHAHIDHMDPLTRGGQDAWRNAVYCCGRCNLAKRNLPFVKWLSTLDATRREEKDGYPPSGGYAISGPRYHGVIALQVARRRSPARAHADAGPPRTGREASAPRGIPGS